MRRTRLFRIFLALTFCTLALALSSCKSPAATSMTSASPNPSAPPEVEATEFSGLPLTPIVQQQNNALKGTQNIDRETYRLTVDGLVEKPLSLSYADLQAYPQDSIYMELDCVDGWTFPAKFSGPRLKSIFNDAGVKPEALIAIFYTVDDPEGYTSLDFSYLIEKNVMIALKDNDITLPPERGFPFQVIAENKFGYKWAKWVTRIELSANTQFRGYWEGHGYNNQANINGPRFEEQQ